MEQNKKVFLIRHAQSEFNIYEEKAAAENIPRSTFKYMPELLDANLSKLGVEQATPASDIGKDLDIKLVIASPLRRALKTATLIFKDHPNKPKIIAVPELVEHVGSSCDIPDELSKIKEEFPHVDFSVIDSYKNPRLWIFETMQDLDIKENFMRALSNDEETFDYIKLILESIIKSKDGFETRKGEGLRVEVAKQIIAKYRDEFSNIAVVAHYSFLKMLTATVFNESNRAVDGILFKNAQIYEWK